MAIKEQTEELLCDFLCQLYMQNPHLSARQMNEVSTTVEDFLMHWKETILEKTKSENISRSFPYLHGSNAVV